MEQQQSRAKRVFVLALFLFVVPILGWLTSMYIESTLESQFRQIIIPEVMSEAEYVNRGFTYLGVCGTGGVLRDAEGTQKLCSLADEVEEARLASAATAMLGLALLLSIFGGKIIAGKDRRKLSAIFGPMVRVVMLLLAVSVVAQAGLLIYSIYTIEAAAIHRVHGGILAAIGIGALVVSFQLLKKALGLLNSEPSRVRAKLLSRTEHPALYGLVDRVARKLGAEPPDQIVVGLEPNFFVTSSDTILIGTDNPKLTGRTLFLSLGLMRVMSEPELTAVIGHELGHFRGLDTEYSLRFAPIYARLSGALSSVSPSGEGASAIASLPAVATLSVCLTEFAEAERAVGRERELLADKAGAEAATATDLATALVKVSLYAECWRWLTQKHIELLSEGRYYENLAITYRGFCDTVFDDLEWQAAKVSFSEYVQPHPIDTHPPLAQRLLALGVAIDGLDATSGKPAEGQAISLVSNADELERGLTTLEIQWLVANGAVVIPQTADQSVNEPAHA